MGAEPSLSRLDEDRWVWERVLIPLSLEMSARAHELSALLAERMRAAGPEIYGDPEAIESNRASIEASLLAIADSIASSADPRPAELPPETVAYARASARQSIPIGPLLRNYRLAHAAVWEWAMRELAARARDRDELARATEIASAWLFAYVDTAMILADEIYSSERERFARSAAALRTETVTAILEQHETDARAAGRRLRYELDREHLGICAWLERSPVEVDSVGMLESAILQIAHALGIAGVLLHPLGLLDAAGWVSSASALELAPLEQLRLGANASGDVRVAVGEPAHGLAGFRSTYLEALNARRVATLTRRPAGSVTRYGSVSLQALASADIDQARAFVDRELGALAADDDTCRRLVATLRVYLDEHASRSRAAKRLGIHENTISYRIHQAEGILGRSVEQDTLNLRVALVLATLAADGRE